MVPLAWSVARSVRRAVCGVTVTISPPAMLEAVSSRRMMLSSARTTYSGETKMLTTILMVVGCSVMGSGVRGPYRRV